MEKEKKYEWRACFNGAGGFSVKLHNGFLSYGDNGVGLRGGSGNGHPNATWGEGGTYTGGDFMPIPKSLHLIWMSFIEDQFYEAHIKLDTLKIKNILDKGYNRFIDEKVVKRYSQVFVVNVMPGGGVTVWLDSGDFNTEVGFYPQIATKTNINWKEFVPMGIQNRKKYIDIYLSDIPNELLEQYKTEGLPLDRWAGYRDVFKYNLGLKEYDEQIFIHTYLFNGEQQLLKNKSINIDYKGAFLEQGLPKELRLVWKEENIYYTVNIKIKETELEKMKLFFKEHNNTATFKVETKYKNDPKGQIKLFLINGDDKEEVSLHPHIIYKDK
ncbi:DUF2931 family protein [Tenacibaculum finnmarkense]|uniref:DUF2931 family protein n=1 Tax=Tenacibaculum finnmarkense TaxID=2781243 RepID=UPI001EFB074D|nr:DUF2931 family protein [Tenacibaculum finnmarkense]